MDTDLRGLARQLTPNDVCAELLALSVVEHSRTPDVSIELAIDGAQGRLVDTGCGMRLTPDPGDHLSHAERALTGYYPCLPANEEVETVLRELIWGERGSFGPALANAACVSLRFSSRRGGEVWSQTYAEGKPEGPATYEGATETHGTTIEFRTRAPMDMSAVEELVSALQARIPGLALELSRGLP